MSSYLGKGKDYSKSKTGSTRTKTGNKTGHQPDPSIKPILKSKSLHDSRTTMAGIPSIQNAPPSIPVSKSFNMNYTFSSFDMNTSVFTSGENIGKTAPIHEVTSGGNTSGLTDTSLSTGVSDSARLTDTSLSQSNLSNTNNNSSVSCSRRSSRLSSKSSRSNSRYLLIIFEV